MENMNSIESSLQKKIKQNDEKLKLLLNKGLYNDNYISSNKRASSYQGKEDINIMNDDNQKIKKFNTNKIELGVNRNKNNYYKRAISQEKTHRKKMDKSNNIFSSFNETIELFKEDMKKKFQNLNKLKLEIQKTKKELYSHKSYTNGRNKKNNNDKVKNISLVKQQNLKNKREPKKELKANKIKKETLKLQSAPTAKNKTNINKFFDNLEKWDKSRKEKIDKMKKEQEEKIENEFDYMPKINEKSLKLVKKNKLRKNQPNTFIRLSQQDKILKEKRKILIDMYTPSFKPHCNDPKNLNFKIKSKYYNFTEPNQLDKNEEFDSDDKKGKNINEDSNEEEEEEKDELEDVKIDEFDYRQDMMKYTDTDIEETLRNSLFHQRHIPKK